MNDCEIKEQRQKKRRWTEYATIDIESVQLSRECVIPSVYVGQEENTQTVIDRSGIKKFYKQMETMNVHYNCIKLYKTIR